MAATEKGVWNLQEVRDKQLASEWTYEGPDDPGGAYVWGTATGGSSGISNDFKRSSPTQIGTNTNWTEYYQGGSSGHRAIGVKSDGTLWTWGQGDNSSGALGQNNQTDYSSPKQVGTDTTWSTTTYIGNSGIAVKNNGTMWAWGLNQYGQLGLGEASNPLRYSSPTQIPGTWSTTTGSTILGYNEGQTSVFSVKTNGTLWAWGNNEGGLGLNDTTDRSSPTQVGTDTTWSSEDGHLGTAAMRKGAFSAIKTDGTLWTWGEGDFGQSGHNNRTVYSSPRQVPGTYIFTSRSLGNNIAAGGGSATIVIKDDTTMWGMGSLWYGMTGNNYGNGGQTTLPATYVSSPVQMAGGTTGWATVCQADLAVYGTKTDGTLWAWGYNGDGQLGNNQNQPSGLSSPVQIPGTDWKFISSANYSVGAIKVS
tara:strand:- start:55 stop:1314 length:1260 start_codon:yes stop_codon:yes gene_type:complete